MRLLPVSSESKLTYVEEMMKRVTTFRHQGVFLLVCVVLACGKGDPPQSVDNRDTDPPLGPPDIDDYPGLSVTLSEDCHDIDELDGGPFVSYYWLRVEYSTSADWSKLEFEEPEQVMRVRTLSIEGTADKAIADYGGITVNQAKSSADNGNVVKVVADYALRPEVLEAPFSLELGQGVIGEITVRISAVVGEQVQLIKEVTEPKGAKFQVELSQLSDSTPWLAPLARVRRMVWALYYPWYTLPGWENDTLKDQPEVLYDSGDRVAIERQINQAKSAGIDGFISSWWGPDSKTDRNLVTVLDVAAQNDFYVGMFLETKSIIEAQNSDMALVEDEIVRWIEYYVTNYGDHPGQMRVDGKPFIMPWITCTVPAATWQSARERLRGKGIEVTMIADCDKAEYVEVFDGARGREPETGKALRYYAALSDNTAPKIWLSDAMPGYDERLLDRKNPRYYDREDGDYFKRELADALLANPQWVRIYTWNEYPENTYIEPSKNFADKYLRIAGDYLLPWKCPE